jgi:hypothetical protein
MKKQHCEILDVFNTSIGTVVFIGVSNDFVPKIGYSFKSIYGNEWIASAVGSNRIYELVQSKYKTSKFKSIWDCVVTSINNAEVILSGSIIDFGNVGNVSDQ